jgi:DNA-directed RNA polymerase specialized sigma24 family protein
LLREVAGLSYPEIAETLEVTLPTVKWRIFHARETVALALAQGDIEELGSRIPA